jgi:hypothetical protein
MAFDVHGSVHLGNIYVQLKVQIDVLFVFFIPLYFLALHVSGAIALILRSTGPGAPTVAYSHRCV